MQWTSQQQPQKKERKKTHNNMNVAVQLKNKEQGNYFKMSSFSVHVFDVINTLIVSGKSICERHFKRTWKWRGGKKVKNTAIMVIQ